MTIINNTAAMIYCEQVDAINDCFRDWSNCQRTAMILDLLKLLPLSCLKLVQSTIETKFAQSNITEQITILEQHANNKMHMEKLCDSYRMASIPLKKDSLLLYSDALVIDTSMNNNNNNHITSNNNVNNNNNNSNNACDNCNNKLKEKILKDIVDYLPLLRVGNHDAKNVYLTFIPAMMADAQCGLVKPPIVQEIMSFMLIHPAFTEDDRGIMKHHIGMLKEIITNYNHIEQINRAIAPPAVVQSLSSLSSTTSSQNVRFNSNENLWDHHIYSMSSHSQDLTESIGINTGFLCDEQNSDVSFSKNGTEIADFDGGDSDKSNTQIACCENSDLLTVPNLIDQLTIKTQRSNSLTTGTTPFQHSIVKMYSNENLAMTNKPRRLSLPYASPRSLLVSSGSETRLDDNGLHPHIGMSNILVWLKSLRLHKYQMLFDGLTYEQMMDITPEYLLTMSCTAGATKKLVNCIQKLNERYAMLTSMEQQLKDGTLSIKDGVDELGKMVVTPMKPLDEFNPEDVPTQFLKVLTLAYNMLDQSFEDKEVLDNMSKIVEQASGSEAFIGQAHIREQLSRMNKLKSKYPSAYSKSCGPSTGVNPNKTRYPSNSKNRKPGNNICSSNTIDHRMHRKNSNPLPTGHQQKNPRYYAYNTKYHSTTPVNQINNKSSSYPNFQSNACGPPQTNYHRNSISNLITIKPSQSGAMPSNTNHQHLATGNLFSTTSAKTCGTISTACSLYDTASLKTRFDLLPHVGISQQSHHHQSHHHHQSQRSSSSGADIGSNRQVGDINRGLEFLCLKMTEQAIN